VRDARHRVRQVSARWNPDPVRERGRCYREAARKGQRAAEHIAAALNPPAQFHPAYLGDVNRFIEDNVACAVNCARSAAHYAGMAERVL
jgi:hypothetical protein